jgi:hypothetical protein
MFRCIWVQESVRVSSEGFVGVVCTKGFHVKRVGGVLGELITRAIVTEIGTFYNTYEYLKIFS